MFFIDCSNTLEVLEQLAASVLNYRIVPFLGCPGAGKSWLLQYLASDEYWQKEQPAVARPPRIAYTKLWKAEGKSTSRGVTPTSLVTFSELTLGLAQISRTYDPPLISATKLWYRKPVALATDRQFASLFAFVRDELTRLQVGALLIDNAQLMDVFTLQRLMQARQLCRHNLALIFCARIEAPGEINDHLSRTLDVVLKESEGYEEKVELRPLAEQEVKDKILKGLLADLRIDFSPELKLEEIAAMRKMFWTETRGDWKSLNRLHRRFSDVLGSYRGQRRYITKEAWRLVTGKDLYQ